MQDGEETGLMGLTMVILHATKKESAKGKAKAHEFVNSFQSLTHNHLLRLQHHNHLPGCVYENAMETNYTGSAFNHVVVVTNFNVHELSHSMSLKEIDRCTCCLLLPLNF